MKKKPAGNKPPPKKPVITNIIVIVARPHGAEWQYLLFHKPADRAWQPVAGNISASDRRRKKPIEAAMQRELKKESGVKAGKVTALGIVHRDDGSDPKYARAYLKVIPRRMPVSMSAEHDAMKWALPGEAAAKLAHSPRFATALQRSFEKIVKLKL